LFLVRFLTRRHSVTLEKYFPAKEIKSENSTAEATTTTSAVIASVHENAPKKSDCWDTYIIKPETIELLNIQLGMRDRYVRQGDEWKRERLAF
jgi:hypothetical protein